MEYTHVERTVPVMKHKLLLTTAIVFILVGVVGMAAYKFKFSDAYPEHNQTWALQANELKKLSIISDYKMDISFTTGSSNEGYVKFQGNMHPEVIERLNSLTLGGSEFSIDLTPPNTSEFFSVNFNSPMGKIDVMLPQGSELDLLDITTYSADISLHNASSKNMKISSASGDIKASDLLANEIKLESMSGNIEGSNLIAGIHVINRSGNVDLTQTEGDVTIENLSGNISVGQHGLSSIIATSISGNIDIAADPEFNGLYQARSLSGSVNTPISLNESKQKITADTKSGDIDVRLSKK